MAKRPNVRPLGAGWQLYTRVRGQFVSKYLDYEPTTTEVKAWRRLQHVEPHLLNREAQDAPSFLEDVQTDLRLRRSMPSFQDRRQHLQEWAQVFGNRPRPTITAPEIRAQLERWLAAGYSPGSVNRRRTALMALWTDLDGKSARNPVRDVPRYPEGEGEIRALAHGLIYRILACMRPSKTRARLRVLAWTGWPHTQIGHLKPEHWDATAAQAYVTPRHKGQGTRGDWLPLLPPAVTALREFDQWDAYGRFSASAMHSAFQRAVDRLNRHRKALGLRSISARPYDLRHSFGVLAAVLFRDDQVVQRLMLHSSPMQTQRYIRAARAYRLETAIATFATSDDLSRVLASLRGVGASSKQARKQAVSHARARSSVERASAF